MKLLLVTGIFPPDIGGPATYVPEIATSLAMRGHQVQVLTTSEPENLCCDDRSYPFQVVRMNRRVSLWRRPWDYFKSICYYGRDVDLIYANGVFLETALANKWLHKPLVIKVVGDPAWERARNRGWVKDNFEVFQQQRYNLKVEILKAIRTWSICQADKAIVPSNYLRSKVAQWGIPQEKLAVIYNAVDLPCDIQPAELPLVTSINIVTVGRLVSWKQIDKLIEAIAPSVNVGLVIIGDGPERSRLEKMVSGKQTSDTTRATLRDRVYFAGQLPQQEMLTLMAACDLFVLNSTYEGLPHVVLEAMSLRLPVVATAVGGTPELVRDGENGRLITDDSLLSEVLCQLLYCPTLRQKLALGALDTVRQFNWLQLVAETEAVLWKTVHSTSDATLNSQQ